MNSKQNITASATNFEEKKIMHMQNEMVGDVP
jgi:hypothetical protein